MAKNSFESILAEYNFEYEFEIAICKLLKLLLPKKYSICRGYIITSNDETIGDDIIIYDSHLFPKIRLIEDDLSIKQYIPADAVYAYIEAKHTLSIDTTSKDPTLAKALKQIHDAKNIKRDQRLLNQFGNFMFHMNIEKTEGWPNCRNPMYGAIISRYVKSDNNSPVNEKEFINSAGKFFSNDDNYKPDLIIAGDKIVCLPIINDSVMSPFFIPEESRIVVWACENSIAVGIMSLISALNYIELNPLNYKLLMAEALKAKVV